MQFGISFDICCFVFLTMLSIVYFGKKRTETEENKIYTKLLILSSFGLIIESLCHWTAIVNFDPKSIFVAIISRVFLLFMLYWSILFTDYIYVISKKKHIFEKHPIILNILVILLSVIIAISPIKYYNDGIYTYSYGIGTYILYALDALLIVLDITWILLNYKNIEKKKVSPLILLIILMTILIIVKFINPGINLISPIFSLVIFLMYFTIENSDITLINQLEIAKEQADKANDAKTEFLSSMSHEIRTPLNAIVGFSDYIMTSESLEEVKDNARNILEASNTLLEIVNGILDISKIEAGKMEIINSKYNAREIYGSIYKLISPKMKEKGLEFDYYISSDVPETLYGDHANIKKVITEIINNAYKYTDMGYVRYKVNCKNTEEISQLIITIEDSGRGIKQENVNKIFNKFERLEQDRNTTIEGTGLGLSLTKQLVALMGGEVIVETAFGSGTKFTVILNQKIETTPVESTLELDTTLDLTDKNILIVDDNSLNIKVTKKLLERHNATNIEYTTNGYDCVEKIKRGAVFDLIFLDDMMPKISGIETFKLLKEIPNFNQPVVIFTANAIAGMREQYLSQGFTDYLAKPIDKNELIRVCNTILYKGQPQTNQPISSVEKVATVEHIEPVQQTQVTNQIEKVELIEPISQVQQLEEVELVEPIPQVQQLEEVALIEQISQVESTIPVVNASQNSEIYLRQNGVDLDKSLELLGDIDMYNMTISDFLSEVEDKWQNIIQYKNINDMKNYAIEVHSLKSDAKYLGFMSLAEIAYQHELKSKEEDSSFVNEHFNELQIEYSKALELAKNYNQMIN